MESEPLNSVFLETPPTRKQPLHSLWRLCGIVVRIDTDVVLATTKHKRSSDARHVLHVCDGGDALVDSARRCVRKASAREQSIKNCVAHVVVNARWKWKRWMRVATLLLRRLWLVYWVVY